MSEVNSNPITEPTFAMDLGIAIVDKNGEPVENILKAWKALSERSDDCIPIYKIDTKNVNNQDGLEVDRFYMTEINITFRYDEDFDKETSKDIYTFDKLPEFLRNKIRGTLNSNIKPIQQLDDFVIQWSEFIRRERNKPEC